MGKRNTREELEGFLEDMRRDIVAKESALSEALETTQLQAEHISQVTGELNRAKEDNSELGQALAKSTLAFHRAVDATVKLQAEVDRLKRALPVKGVMNTKTGPMGAIGLAIGSAMDSAMQRDNKNQNKDA